MYRASAGAAVVHTSVPSGAVLEVLGKVGISGNGCPGWKGSDELSRDIAIAMGDPRDLDVTFSGQFISKKWVAESTGKNLSQYAQR